jgi:hypothetical protein
MVFGPDGNLYVASGNFVGSAQWAPGSVLRFEGPTGPNPGALLGTFVAGGSGGLSTPCGLLFGPDGKHDGRLDLYVTSVVGSFRANSGKTIFIAAPGTSEVLRYDGTSGAFVDTFVAPDSEGLQFPTFMTFTETDPTTLNYVGARQTPASATSIIAPVGMVAGTATAIGPGTAMQTIADTAPPQSRPVAVPFVLAIAGHPLHQSFRPENTTVIQVRRPVNDILLTDLGTHSCDRTPVNGQVRFATD